MGISSSNDEVIKKRLQKNNYLYFKTTVFVFYSTKNFPPSLGLETIIAHSAIYGWLYYLTRSILKSAKMQLFVFWKNTLRF